jgi:DNA-binding FadR family transcriptional regulator
MPMSAAEDTLLESRVSRAESLARELERQIMDEVVPAGGRLGTKAELRRRFGVATTTVNEAVRMLETRGLVAARPGPGGGVFVAAGSARMALSHSTLRFKRGGTTFHDYLFVRDTLEPAVCREAARNQTPEDIAALERILDQMEKRLDDPLGYMRANYRLHRRVAKLCANAPLHDIYLSLLDSMEREMEAAELADFDGAAHLAEHRELVAAIAAGEGKRLEKAIAKQSPSYIAPR